jgi:hypothetical protein
MRTWPIPILLLVMACGGASPPRNDDIHAGNPRGEKTSAADVDFSSWRSWRKVNAKRFLSKGHGGKWVDVYVEEKHADRYLNRNDPEPAPVGMRIVKVGYRDEAGTAFEALTAMAKMQAGYDPTHADWWYGVLSEDARTARTQGKIEMCIHCHEEGEHTHFLFGIPTE